MNNKCKYLKQRQKDYKWYGYCIKRKEIVPLFCKECNNIEYKEKKALKSRTNKQVKREKERFSIIYSNLTKCCECGLKTGDYDERINMYTVVSKNEVFEGSFRQRSIDFGMITPFCIFCHDKFHHDTIFNLSYKVMFEKEYLKTHTKEEFIKVFGQDYIFKLEQKKRS